MAAWRFACLLYLVTVYVDADTSGEWTNWMWRDVPSGNGDFEERALFNRIPCGGATPLKVDARLMGTTSSVLTTSEDRQYKPGEQELTQFVRAGPVYGFACWNRKQISGQRCKDYEVRFLCPVEVTPGVWTNWMWRDYPSGNGDFETRADFNPIPCGGASPLKVDARLMGTTTSVLTTSEDRQYKPGEQGLTQFVQAGPVVGFVCWNKKQISGQFCKDYEVRFLCPLKDDRLIQDGEAQLNPGPKPSRGDVSRSQVSQNNTTVTPVTSTNGLWTNWMWRDLPSGNGDFETRADFKQIPCGGAIPLKVDARLMGTTASVLTTSEDRQYKPGEQGLTQLVRAGPVYGFACWNRKQIGRPNCKDYEVRFLCPMKVTPRVLTNCMWKNLPSGNGNFEERFLFTPIPWIRLMTFVVSGGVLC